MPCVLYQPKTGRPLLVFEDVGLSTPEESMSDAANLVRVLWEIGTGARDVHGRENPGDEEGEQE